MGEVQGVNKDGGCDSKTVVGRAVSLLKQQLPLRVAVEYDGNGLQILGLPPT